MYKINTKRVFPDANTFISLPEDSSLKMFTNTNDAATDKGSSIQTLSGFPDRESPYSKCPANSIKNIADMHTNTLFPIRFKSLYADFSDDHPGISAITTHLS